MGWPWEEDVATHKEKFSKLEQEHGKLKDEADALKEAHTELNEQHSKKLEHVQRASTVELESAKSEHARALAGVKSDHSEKSRALETQIHDLKAQVVSLKSEASSAAEASSVAASKAAAALKAASAASGNGSGIRVAWGLITLALVVCTRQLNAGGASAVVPDAANNCTEFEHAIEQCRVLTSECNARAAASDTACTERAAASDSACDARATAASEAQLLLQAAHDKLSKERNELLAAAKAAQAAPPSTADGKPTAAELKELAELRRSVDVLKAEASGAKATVADVAEARAEAKTARATAAAAEQRAVEAEKREAAAAAVAAAATAAEKRGSSSKAPAGGGAPVQWLDEMSQWLEASTGDASRWLEASAGDASRWLEASAGDASRWLEARSEVATARSVCRDATVGTLWLDACTAPALNLAAGLAAGLVAMLAALVACCGGGGTAPPARAAVRSVERATRPVEKVARPVGVPSGFTPAKEAKPKAKAKARAKHAK